MPITRFEINFEYRSQCPDCGIETEHKGRQLHRCALCQTNRQIHFRQLRLQFRELGCIPEGSPLALRCHDCGVGLEYVPRQGGNSDRCETCRKELAKLLRKVKSQNRRAESDPTVQTIAGSTGEPCPRCRHPHGIHSDGEYAICVNCSYQPDLANGGGWTFSPLLTNPARVYRRSAGAYDHRTGVTARKRIRDHPEVSICREVVNPI